MYLDGTLPNIYVPLLFGGEGGGAGGFKKWNSCFPKCTPPIIIFFLFYFVIFP
jgi:hypothetical protein